VFVGAELPGPFAGLQGHFDHFGVEAPFLLRCKQHKRITKRFTSHTGFYLLAALVLARVEGPALIYDPDPEFAKLSPGPTKIQNVFHM